ncbi:ASCH domain-containing protein [Tunturiibacter empetritectus]|uniref:ASCH domain-containing protein n=2 Tax=Tunturiibacter TaxID=3154218 RepID=A0A852VDX0_9BACT|nr:ASCH domain-containing protein [Edaphobacter lichenicola]NYF89707.1 hypothetical protein [Edaphobacter lichenicola]
MAAIIRAISVKQPFAEQILRGSKRYEYRTVPTNIRERVYIYASLKPRREEEFWRKMDKSAEQLPKGKIVGSVQIVGCIEIAGCKSNRKEFAYKLANPKRLRTHLVPTNQPGPVFWRPHF